MSKSLIITEKPSVAGDIAKALGGFKKGKDYYENDEIPDLVGGRSSFRARCACLDERAGQMGHEEAAHHAFGIRA